MPFNQPEGAQSPQTFVERCLVANGIRKTIRELLVLLLNVLSLGFIVLHAITWFNLAPRALVFRRSQRFYNNF